MEDIIAKSVFGVFCCVCAAQFNCVVLSLTWPSLNVRMYLQKVICFHTFVCPFVCVCDFFSCVVLC